MPVSRRGFFGFAAGSAIGAAFGSTTNAEAEVDPLYWQDRVDWDEVERLENERRAVELAGTEECELSWFNKAARIGSMRSLKTGTRLRVTSREFRKHGSMPTFSDKYWARWNSDPEQGPIVTEIVRSRSWTKEELDAWHKGRDFGEPASIA